MPSRVSWSMLFEVAEVLWSKTRWMTQDEDREDWDETSRMKRCFWCAMEQTTPNITSAKWLVRTWATRACEIKKCSGVRQHDWEKCACDKVCCLHSHPVACTKVANVCTRNCQKKSAESRYESLPSLVPTWIFSRSICWFCALRSPRGGASSARFTFFLVLLKTFSKYPALEICTFWNSSFRLPKGRTSTLRRLFPAAGWVWRFVSSPLFPGVWGLSIALLPPLRIHCRAFVGGPRRLFPAAGWDIMLVQILILWAVQISYLLSRNFPQVREVQIHKLRLCHCWSLFQVAFLNALWHGALLPDRIRKKRAKNGERKHWKIHEVQQTKKMVPLITCVISFGRHVNELVFDVNAFDKDL